MRSACVLAVVGLGSGVLCWGAGVSDAFGQDSPTPVVSASVPPTANRSRPTAVPRTAEGQPDLQGLWVNDTATPLERPRESGARATFTPEEARAYEQRYQLDRTVAISRDKAFELDAAADIDTYEPGRVLPDGRNALITDPADGRVPALTPDAQRRLADRTRRLDEHYAENPEDLTFAERCIIVANTSAPPMMPAFYNNTVQIVQTRDAVMLLSEMIHDVRIVDMTRTTHLPAAIQLWKGDSIGRWDGDSLIIDTRNFTDKTSFRGSTPALHVVERLTWKQAGVLSYEFTVDDPAFTRPWSGRSEWTRAADASLFEYACHEGNQSLPIVLSGRRFGERGAALAVPAR